MSDKYFDPTKPCTTRSGHPARIVCTDMKAKQPLVGIITLDNDHEISSQFTSAGRYYEEPDRESTLDLINVPVKRKGWIGVAVPPIQRVDGIVATSSYIYRSEDEARRQTEFKKYIEIEFEE